MVVVYVRYSHDIDRRTYIIIISKSKKCSKLKYTGYYKARGKQCIAVFIVSGRIRLVVINHMFIHRDLNIFACVRFGVYMCVCVCIVSSMNCISHCLSPCTMSASLPAGPPSP